MQNEITMHILLKEYVLSYRAYMFVLNQSLLKASNIIEWWLCYSICQQY